MTPSIINYMSSLTNYSFERATLERIAIERGVDEFTDVTLLTKEQKDLVLADMLLVLFLSPSQTPSISKKHGSYSLSIGSQVITDKEDIYNLMVKLYSRWNDDKLADIEDMGGGIEWVHETEE